MNGVRPFLRWPNLCLAGPLFGVVVLYLTSGAMDLPHGWLWQREGYDWPRLMRRLPLFYLTEFLLLAVLLAVVRPGGAPGALLHRRGGGPAAPAPVLVREM